MTTYVEFETADGTILVEVAEVKDKRTTPTGGVVKASRDDVDKKVQEVIEKAHYTFESGLDVVRRNADAFVKKMNELAASPAGGPAGLLRLGRAVQTDGLQPGGRGKGRAPGQADAPGSERAGGLPVAAHRCRPAATGRGPGRQGHRHSGGDVRPKGRGPLEPVAVHWPAGGGGGSPEDNGCGA